MLFVGVLFLNTYKVYHMIMTHQAVWAAIDGIAERYSFSCSGLAKAAGLNATTFNKSKRFTTSGRERWPSTESIAKVLDATGAGFDEFIALMLSADPNRELFGQALPIIDMRSAQSHDHINQDGLLFEGDWDMIHFPDVRDERAFALEVIDDDYEPVYWAGDILIISPNSEVRRGDRIVVKLRDGTLFVCQLLRKTAKRVEVAKLQTTEVDRVLDISEVEWISRIVWVRQ